MTLHGAFSLNTQQFINYENASYFNLKWLYLPGISFWAFQNFHAFQYEFDANIQMRLKKKRIWVQPVLTGTVVQMEKENSIKEVLRHINISG